MKSLIIITIVVVFLFSTPVFAQVQNSIVVTTNKPFYSMGETVLITGEVSELYHGFPASMTINAPNGSVVYVDQLTVNEDKKFSIEIIAGEPFLKVKGTYTINVEYKTGSNSATTSFGIGDEKIIQSWFKHVALWWSNETISTNEFMASTAHLIKEGMIKTENEMIQSSNVSYEKGSIPEWIKNGAGWWGRGEITDDTFVDSIEYMIVQGMSFPSTPSSSSLLNSFDIEKIPTVNGLKVVWTNNDSQSHTITSGTVNNANEFFDSKLIQPDQSFSSIFKKEGSHPYFCMIHPWESDVLSVTSSDLSMFYEEKLRLEQEKRLEEERKLEPIKKEIAPFVDESKDPQYYIDRYNNEANYKKWFDENYPQYDSIEEAVGVATDTLSFDESSEEKSKQYTLEEALEIQKQRIGEGESEITTSTLSFYTSITNPNDINNSEFYNINTGCQLKYFFYKDPAKTSEIYSLMIQNEQRIEQEYFARTNEMGDNALLMEIVAEVIMEQYSINPILKDSVVVISDRELPQEEIQQIQQGNHLCEEEFSLYSLSEDTQNLVFTTKTPFVDIPINGAEVGQWVKYQFEITGSNENMRNAMISSFSKSLRGANFDLDDVEWLKRKVTDITGNEITVQDEYKVSGKTSLFTNTITYDFTNYPLVPFFIPTNVEKGNILFQDISFGDLYIDNFQKKNYGGKNIDTIHVTVSNEYHQADEFVKSYIENYYDKKTGMLLEGQVGGQSTLSSNSFEINFQIKAINFHIPSSSNVVEGGGCLIATATYGTELAPQVQQLRELRDNQLLTTESGTSFMSTFNNFYYSFSPIIADYERENPLFREMVKIVITPMISSLSILNYVAMESEVEVLGYGISLIMLNLGMYVIIPVLIILRIRRI